MANEKHDDDHVHLGPRVGEDGVAFVRCHPDGTTHAGVLRPAKEGEPLYDGAIRLEHRGPGPVYNVIDEYKRETPQQCCEERSGPAKVTTDAYRNGWDNLFGNQTVGQA